MNLLFTIAVLIGFASWAYPAWVCYTIATLHPGDGLDAVVAIVLGIFGLLISLYLERMVIQEHPAMWNGVGSWIYKAQLIILKLEILIIGGRIAYVVLKSFF